MSQRKITIKDVAQKVGCAPSMVSMAMNNKDGISSHLKERILHVAQELNWAPNHASATLRKGVSNKILMVLPYDGLVGNINANSGMLSLMDGLIKGLEPTDFDLDITIEIEDPKKLYPRLYRERQPMAFAFVNIRHDDWRIRYLTAQKIPFISFGQTSEDIMHHFVDFDNVQYAYEATKTILKQDVSDIFLFASDMDYTYSRELRKGYQKAFMEAGKPIDERYIIHSHNLAEMQSPAILFEQIQSQDLKGKGFVSPTSSVTIWLLHQLQQQNIDPSKDVQIASIVVGKTLELLAPYVHLWRQDTQDAGHKMAQTLCEILLKPTNLYHQHIYTFQKL